MSTTIIWRLTFFALTMSKKIKVTFFGHDKQPVGQPNTDHYPDSHVFMWVKEQTKTQRFQVYLTGMWLTRGCSSLQKCHVHIKKKSTKKTQKKPTHSKNRKSQPAEWTISIIFIIIIVKNNHCLLKHCIPQYYWAIVLYKQSPSISYGEIWMKSISNSAPLTKP